MKDLKNIAEKILFFFRLVLKKVLLVGSTTFLVVVALVLMVMVYIFTSYEISAYRYNKFRQAKPFDARVWQQTNPQERSFEDKKYARCYMYKDLVENVLHFGMSYEEAIKLLGEPGFVEYYAHPKSKSIGSYVIGYCTMQFEIYSGIKGYGLFLDFDSNSRLVEFGHNDDMKKEKKWVLKNIFKKRKYLFTCYSDNECVRYIELLKIKKWKKWFYGNRESVCSRDDQCKRMIENSNDDRSVFKREECHKSEVEAKWGYKVW